MDRGRTTGEAMVRRLCEHGPFGGDEEASGALVTMLEVLGECLSSDDAHALADDLPEPLAGRVRPGGGRCEPRQVYQRIAHRRGVRLGLAVEQAQVVGQVLAEAVSRPTLERLQQHSPQLRELFAGSPAEAAAPARPLPEGPARGGGGPPTGHPEIVAHEHSIARSDDPHGDTKLSSSRGLTQEREGRSLSTARPPKR